jgi:hypothetical protein
MLGEDRLATAFMRADAHYGGRLVITTPYGAYRSRADQMYLRNRYLADPKRYAYAAPPGNSWHERGLAVDIANWAMFPDLQDVMKSYGFKRDALEDWHYNYVGGGTATAGNGGVAIPVEPEPPKPTEDDMTVFAVEMTSAGQPEYQMIALYGDVANGWVEILPKDREGFFNPWRSGEGAARGVPATDIPLRGVSLAEWNVLRSVHQFPKPAAVQVDSAAIAKAAADAVKAALSGANITAQVDVAAIAAAAGKAAAAEIAARLAA